MRKLVVFSDCRWVQPQYRSRKRRVPGNAELAYSVVSSRDAADNEQICFMNCLSEKRSLSRCLLQQTFGIGMQAELFECYKFLARNYRDGDEIFLIGGGMGAFNLRRLADLIDKVGLLEKRDIHLLPEAFEYGQIPVEALDTPAAASLRERFAGRPARIRFLGCWDTVGSYGLPTPGLRRISESWMMFTDHKINRNVDTAYQALALDERRSRFKPGLWVGNHSPELKEMEQVWFAGSHENVVGGQRDSGLSDIAFLWLINRAVEQGLGVDPEKLDEVTAPDPMGRIAMNRRKVFGLPLPFRKVFTRPVGQLSRELGTSFRSDPEKLHESVLKRQEADQKYRPRQLASLSEGDIPVYRENFDTPINKRRHVRHKIDWPAFLIAGEKKMNVSLVDYSRTGARVWLNGKLPVGSSYVLQSSRSLVDGLKSRVVWTRDNFIGLEFAKPLARLEYA